MSSRISVTSARLDNAAAMTVFLAPIPNGERLARLLEERHPIVSRAYDDDTWTARFVASDGIEVTCFTVTDITIDQAEMVAAASLEHPKLDASRFRELVGETLGPSADLDTP